MNKSMDNKKAIHSSNYYSFFFKENSYEDNINKEAIERYFLILKNPLKKYKDKRQVQKIILKYFLSMKMKKKQKKLTKESKIGICLPIYLIKINTI